MAVFSLFSRVWLVAIFTFSSFLYQLGFWSRYDISVLGLFNFNDILNSFLFPVSAIFPLIVLLAFTLDYIDKTEKPKWKKFAVVGVTILGSILIVVLVDRIIFKWIGVLRWVMYIMFFYTLISFEWIQAKFENISDNRSFKKLVLFAPMICFGIGRFQAEEIYYNQNYRKINFTLKETSETFSNVKKLKLVSLMNDYVVLTDSNNTNLTILKVQDFSVIKQY
ncbi:MAG TPA: hypothetical protein VK174_11705 [Chitinophagales bacterium]|nr:hypothetical protein [Chitinophagales bacterium]